MKTGCKRWGDCFTCPFSDCMWGDEQELKKFSYWKDYSQKNKEKVRKYKKEYYEQHKEEILARSKERRKTRSRSSQESEVVM